MGTKVSRRRFLEAVVGTSAAGLLAACGGAPSTAQRTAPAGTVQAGAEATAAATLAPAATVAVEEAPAAAADPTPIPPTPTAIFVGQGDIALTMWVQDFAPAVTMFETAAKAVSQTHGDIQVTVQPVPYTDLMAKVLPSVAAGTDPEVLMGYTDWYVATDVSRLFLPLDEIMGGKAALEKILFTEALSVLDTPQGKTYYVPWAAGIRAAATTVNVKHYQAAGIDYLKLASWEEFEEAGKRLTQMEDDKMTRAGLSPLTAALSLVKTWIWQQGGEFYDRESGKWSFATPEGEAAAQRLHDLFWKEPTSSFDLFTNEYEGFSQQLVSTQLDGAWTAGVQEAGNEELDVDVVPTPKLRDATLDVVYPEHMGVLTLSKRLAQDEVRLTPAAELLTQMLSADALLGLTETYSGSLMSKVLYDDPRVMETKYGPISKRVAEGTWPRTRFPQDHVANQAPAAEELVRGLRQEIRLDEALANIDTYLNEQEAQARERIGG